MKHLLFLMMMLYSGYGFCGCIDYGYITLNGKLVACFCPSGLPNNVPIDSAYYYKGNDTVIITQNDSAILDVGNSTIMFTHNLDTEYLYPTNYIYNLTRTGQYYIQQTDYDINCGQSFYLNFVVINMPTGTNNLSQEIRSIQILSNPVSSTLKLSSSKNINKLNIYDELGRLQSSPPITSSQNTYEANVDGLSKGIYVVEVLSGADKKDYLKIVKQ